MFKSCIAFLLIFTVLSANFSRFFIYAAFDINKNYIASVLCENKDKPMLNCKGKCYLSKKIKQAEEKEKSQDQQSQKNRFQEALIAKQIKLYYSPIITRTAVSLETQVDLPKYSSSIFHPPQA